MLIRTLLLAIGLFSLSACSPAGGADGALSADETRVREIVREYLISNPEVLEEALQALSNKRDAELRQNIESDPRHYAVGPEDAKITVVEFFDYRCGFCKAANEWVFELIRTRPDVRVVFKEYPVLGPQSLEASRAAIASLKQSGDKYLRFHQALMTQRGELTPAVIDGLAKSAGLNVERMRRDMADEAINAQINSNHQLGLQADVQGTPAFMINGEFVHGFDVAALERTLRSATEAAKTP